MKYLILFLFAYPSFVIAQLDFRDPVYFNSPKEPSSLSYGDFDGDQLVDLAFTTVTNSKVQIMYSDANGSFTTLSFKAGEEVASAGYSTPITVGDFNQDGKMDIVAFNGYQNSTKKIFILLSKGRDFNPPIVIETLASLQGLALDNADINGDGKLDFIVGFQNNLDEFYTYLGDGNGNFTLKIIPNQTLYVELLKLQDINKDNKIDLIAANKFTPNLSVFLGDGMGNFTFKTNLPTSNPPAAFTIADFSEDNIPDIICSIPSATSLSYFVGDGSGNFSKTLLTIDNSIQPGLSIDNFDFDQDGRKDFVLSGSKNGYGVVIFKNSGNNQFIQSYKPNINDSYIIYYLKCVDLEKDGKSEIISATFARNIIIKKQDQQGDDTINNTVPYGILSSRGASGDLNNDGQKDFVVGTLGGTLAVYMNWGQEKFSEPTFYSTGAGVNEVQLHDFNKDGYLDIIYSTFLGDQREMGVILSDNTGNLTLRKNFLGLGSLGFAVADFNKDTFLDFFTNSGVFAGDGLGNFTYTFVNISLLAIDILPGDFDNDGNVDVFITSSTSQSAFYYGDGTLNFSDLVNFNFSKEGMNARAVDINNDGKLDVVTTAPNQDYISLVVNKGNRTWEEKTLAVGDNPQGLTAGDFNKDNLVDLAVANFYSSNISVLLGDGQGGFSLSHLIKVEGTPSHIALNDFNNDYLPDVLIFSSNINPLIFLYNDLVVEPTTIPSALSFSNRTEKSVSYSFLGGDGDGHLVLLSETNALNQIPADNVFYASNENFGAGIAIGNGYVISRNNQLSGQALNLKPNTKYFLTIFEYSTNQKNTIINYQTTASLSGFFTTKNTQSITLPSITSKTVGDPDFDLLATASSGLPITYTVVNGNIQIAGNTVKIIDAGPVSIKANQYGNDDFIPSQEATLSFCILPSKPTITVTIISPGHYALASSSDKNNSWLLNNAVIPGAINKTYTPDRDGVYSVKVDYSGCSNTSLPTVNLITDVSNLENEVQLFPNPANSNITINSPFLITNSSIEFIDMQGRKTTLKGSVDVSSINLSVESLPDGMYMVLIFTESGIVSKKFKKNNQ